MTLILFFKFDKKNRVLFNRATSIVKSLLLCFTGHEYTVHMHIRSSFLNPFSIATPKIDKKWSHLMTPLYVIYANLSLIICFINYKINY